MCGASFVVLAVNICISIVLEEPDWFQRSGSIIVILGILIAARRVVRLGKEHMNEDWNYPNETVERQRVLLDQRAQYIIGPIVALIGTVIWGYGDILIEWSGIA